MTEQNQRYTDVTIDDYPNLVVGIIETLTNSIVASYKNGFYVTALDMDYDDGLLAAKVNIRISLATKGSKIPVECEEMA